MLETKDLVKEFFESKYPDFKFESYSEYDGEGSATFEITYIGAHNVWAAMDFSVLDFMTFVFNKLNK